MVDDSADANQSLVLVRSSCAKNATESAQNAVESFGLCGGRCAVVVALVVGDER